MKSLNIGNKAPKFSYKNSDGNKDSLDNYLGSKVLLCFYPKDNTPVAAYIYARILFFPMWNGNGWNANTVTTTYVDNITALSSATAGLENKNLFDAKVYPNPASDTWTISTQNNVITSVEVFNLLGERVLLQNNSSTDLTISTRGLTSGVYFARIATAKGVKSVKLIKE